MQIKLAHVPTALTMSSADVQLAPSATATAHSPAAHSACQPAPAAWGKKEGKSQSQLMHQVKVQGGKELAVAQCRQAPNSSWNWLAGQGLAGWAGSWGPVLRPALGQHAWWRVMVAPKSQKASRHTASCREYVVPESALHRAAAGWEARQKIDPLTRPAVQPAVQPRQPTHPWLNEGSPSWSRSVAVVPVESPALLA